MYKSSRRPVISRKSKPRRRYIFWITLLSVLLAMYYIPLLGYVWRLGEAFGEHGFSSETTFVMARHTDWFKRYFTGPPSDEEMIVFFQQHRADLERAADLFARYGGCMTSSISAHQEECGQLEQRTGMRASMGPRFVPNSAYLRSRPVSDMARYVQDHYFYDVEPQNWWRSSNDNIQAWKKSFIYIPPLLPAERFGFDPKIYSDNPLEVMRHACHLKASLDSLPPEIEKDPIPYEECAVRQIDTQWFIHLSPVAKNLKN